jgi:LytS/YehU family sensor histidine kinase
VRRGGILVVEVEDDGPGLPAGWTVTPEEGRGGGLTNVRSRLERLFGSQGRLELLTPTDEAGRPTTGVLARVTILFRVAAPSPRRREVASPIPSARSPVPTA